MVAATFFSIGFAPRPLELLDQEVGKGSVHNTNAISPRRREQLPGAERVVSQGPTKIGDSRNTLGGMHFSNSLVLCQNLARPPHELYQTFGMGGRNEHARSSLLGFLPADVREKSLDRDDLRDVMSIRKFARREIHWPKSDVLAENVAKQYSANTRDAPVAAAVRP